MLLLLLLLLLLLKACLPAAGSMLTCTLHQHGMHPGAALRSHHRHPLAAALT